MHQATSILFLLFFLASSLALFHHSSSHRPPPSISPGSARRLEARGLRDLVVPRHLPQEHHSVRSPQEQRRPQRLPTGHPRALRVPRGASDARQRGRPGEVTTLLRLCLLSSSLFLSEFLPLFDITSLVVAYCLVLLILFLLLLLL